jgi:retron-type reverse transcriptase
MLLQVLTPILDPGFSEHSYGFRPGRSAQDAVRAAQQYAQGGKDWVVDLECQLRHLDGSDRECDPGQTGVADT